MLASVASALIGRAVLGARLDPLADRADAVGQRDRGLPAEVGLRPLDRERAALQLAWPGGGEHGLHGPTRHLADQAGQVENADLDARPDVPRSRAPVVSGGEEGADDVA